ncbi:MAG TPA: hypothetical protein VJ946_09050, partial [Bacteroidales bacterium]|nr:hypothetical protein [Bacteroidales bacterium]
KDAYLFGEAQGRVVVSVDVDKEDEFIDLMLDNDFPFSTLGHVTKGEMRVDDISVGYVKDMKNLYMSALENKIKEK